MQMPMGLEYGRQHRSVAAAHVDDALNLGKVVALCDRRSGKRGNRAHGVVEDGRLLRMLPKIGEEPLLRMLELVGIPPGTDAVGKAAVDRPELPIQEREGAHGARDIGAQTIAHRRQLELSLPQIPHDIEACQ
jgi:hypothetical protein